MTIDFAVAVPTEDAGRAMAKLAEERGYRTSVELGEESNEWTCYCTRSMLATYANVVTAQIDLDTLASAVGGHADGWGTFGNCRQA